MSVTIPKEGLSEIIDATKAMSEGDFNKTVDTKLQGELGDLARYIDKTMRNLRKLDPPLSETIDRMPQASMQLSDITKATEEATLKVISITEKIMEEQDMVAAKIKELRDVATARNIDATAILKIAKEIEEVSNRHKNDFIDILTALSFQDLTGQKIKKIVGLVGEVETRILELLISFGIKEEGSLKKKEMMGQLKKEAAAGLGVNQGLIDNILKDFGM